jgi:hypothetical protein
VTRKPGRIAPNPHHCVFDNYADVIRGEAVCEPLPLLDWGKERAWKQAAPVNPIPQAFDRASLGIAAVR